MKKFIAAIDQGTSSTRCILFDNNGKIVSAAQKDHKQIYPFPGWVEHDPIEIVQRIKEVFLNSLSSAGLSSDEISAIGITNQRETTVVWNRYTGLPYGNAIVWQDIRTADICNQLAEKGGQDRYRSATGLPLATYFSGPKIKWMLDHTPGLQVAAQTGDAIFGTIDTWIIWNLTGGKEAGAHLTDVTNASRTLLMNLQSLHWDPEILSDLDIPRSMLPEIKPSSGDFGQAKDFGGIPILGDLGDQQAALFGQTCFSPGEAKNTYGTGCFLLLNTGDQAVPSKAGLITTLAYQIEGQPPCYCLEGSIAITGALVQWLRDNLKIIQYSSEVEALAASVLDNGDIYFVPAFSGLFAPYWRSDARGVIVGMTRYTNQGHIARAALEATAYQTREVVEAMQLDSGVNLLTLKVDGGMVENNLLMQFQADILGVNIIRPRIAETTALGAAYAAGLSAGVWRSLEELRAQWDVYMTWKPGMDQITRDKLFTGWKKAVTHSFNWESKDAS